MPIDFGQVLGQETLKRFGVVQSGSMQGVKHIFYDTATYTDNTTTSIEFFNTTRSSNSLNYYTNFTQNGQIVSTEAFIVTGFSVAFSPSSYAGISAIATAGSITGIYHDIGLLLFYGNLEADMAYKKYGPFPLWRIGGGGGPYGGHAVATTATATTQLLSWGTNGLPAVNNVYDIVYAIPGGINFFVKLNWGTAQDLGTGNVLVKVMMDGWLLRPVG